MIIFEQLRISDNGRQLFVNVRVNDADYFDNVYLDSITIMTADKVSETDPSAPTGNYIYKKTFGDGVRSAALVLDSTDFVKTWETDADAMKFNRSDMSSTLFFVYVKCKGTVSDSVPCGLDELTNVGVTFDDKLLYQRAMNYTKSLADSCSIPVGFADFILLWNAFKACVETDHYIPAVKYWNMLFGTEGYGVSGDVNAKGCGCHG